MGQRADPASTTRSSLFVGRDAELRVIKETLRAVAGGHPSLVVIRGPAGIGKTALASAVCAAADRFQVLAACGERSEKFLDFGVVDQFLPLVSTAHGRPAGPGDGRRPRQASFTVGTHLLELMGELQDEPLLLLLDDAHWADESSLQALSFVFRRLQADRVAFVVTVRDEEIQAMPRAFVQLLDGPRAARVALSGLSVAEVKELAEGQGLHLSQRGLGRLHSWTAGDPLHVTALLSELGDEAIETNLDEPLPAPRSVADVVQARLASCAPRAREILQAASVLGTRCRLHQLVRMTNIDEPLTAVDQAIQSGLVASVGAGAGIEFRFAHPLMAAAVYHSIPLARKCELHRRAAAVVDEEAVALQHEVLARTGPDPELADRLEAFSRGAAANASWTVAGAALEQAAELSPDNTLRERRLLNATDCWLISGEIAPSPTIDRVARLPKSAPREYILARLSWMTGDPAAAEQGFLRAWNLVDPARDPDFVPRIAGWLGALMVNSGRATGAVEWAGKALAALHDEAAASDHAMIAYMWGHAMLGDAERVLTEVAHLPRNPRLASPEQLEQLLGRAIARLWSGHPVTARPDLECGVRLARERSTLSLLIAALGLLADADYRLGEWDAAIADGELAASMADDTSHAYMSAQCHSLASQAQSARGQWESAERHLETAETIAGQVRDFGSWSYTACARARLELFRGNPAAAAAALSPFLSTTSESVSNPAIHPWRLLLAEAHARLRRLDDAYQFASRAEQEIRGRQCRSELAQLGRVKAEILDLKGDSRGAVRVAESAMQEANRAAAPFEFAYLELILGSILRRHGHRREAKARLESARKTLARLGAVPLLVRCDAELAGSGLRPVHRTVDARNLLTSQELAIARLAAQGLTNKEIAAQLVISPRTVDYHLVHVFAKLEVRSRTQLARRFPVIVPAAS